MWTVYKQAHPRAIEIIESINPQILKDYHGLDEQFWDEVLKQGPLAAELVDICQRDFPTFCALLYAVVPKAGIAGPFLFNRVQRMLWKQMAAMIAALLPLFIIILKARQPGISTFLGAWTFWNDWKQPDFKAIVMAHEVKLAEHIIGMMRVGYDHLPPIDGIKPKLRTRSTTSTLPRSELYFASNRSGAIIHVAKNLDPRGMAAPLLWQSEKAFYQDAAKLDAALLPQLPSRGTAARLRCSFFRESTPNGQNDFYTEYMAAQGVFPAQTNYRKNPHAEDYAMFFPWFLHDEQQFGGYAVERKIRSSAYEMKLRERFSNLRKRYDGKEVSAAQVRWYTETLEQHPYFGDEDYMNMEYVSDDVSCFLLQSDNAFKHVMRYLSETVNDAEARAKEAWAAV